MLLILIIIIIIVLFFFHSCWTFFYYSDDTTYYYSILMIIVIILFLILLLLFTTFTAKERKQLHRKLTMRVVRRVLHCSKLDLHCAVTWPRGTSILMKDMKLSHSEITSFNLFPRKPFICYTHDMVESRTNVYENHTQPKRPLS